MATSLDVARKAGVSQSAVRPGLHARAPRVSESMERARVLKAAAELGYRPNALARLPHYRAQSRIIGLVVAYLDNGFYPVALEKLSKALQERGYRILIFMAPQSADNVDDVLSEILDYQVDGLVLASVAMSSDLVARCAAAGVPVLLFNRTQDDQRFSAVTTDNRGGGRKLAEFLIAGRHERIAYIAGWEGASTQRDREAGFREGVDRRGRGASFVRPRGGRLPFRGSAQAATRRMFTGKPRSARPDAVFVANDHMAIAAMDVLRYELGLRVPEEVSVVSFDDVPQAAWPSYGLTTVRQSAARMVQATVEALMARIEAGDEGPAAGRDRGIAHRAHFRAASRKRYRR